MVIERLERTERELSRLRKLHAAPRYRAVDALISAIRRVPGVHLLARLVWRVATRGEGAR